MGTCSSAQKKTDSAVRASNGVCFKAKEVSIPYPIKEKPLNQENPINIFGIKSPKFGSKEDIFLDSKVWLDSDCEDEFLSVNGDFTPSRCSNANYESMKMMTTTPKKSITLENFFSSKLREPSSTGRKKLAELLQETLKGEKIINDEEEPNTYEESNVILINSSWEGAAAISVSGDDLFCSSEIDQSRKLKNKKELACCIPKLLQTYSFNEKRRLNRSHALK